MAHAKKWGDNRELNESISMMELHNARWSGIRLIMALGLLVMSQGIVRAGSPHLHLYGGFGIGSPIEGTDVEDLTSHETFPDNPTFSSAKGNVIPPLTNGLQNPPMFEEGNTHGENYGLATDGYLTVPETGDWKFYIRSHDGSRFELNVTGSSPFGIETVARVPGDAPGDPFLDDGIRSSQPIRLDQGEKYYFRTLLKAGEGEGEIRFGEDWFQVGWTGPGVEEPTVIGEPHVSAVPEPTAMIFGLAGGLVLLACRFAKRPRASEW